MANFNLSDYVTVNERIEAFYKKFPDGSIQSEILSNVDGQVIIKSFIYRNGEDKRPCIGHAMEKADSTFINKTSHIENCETSAVGRALAMMGFEIKKSVASREEVENAKLNQDVKKTSKVETPKEVIEVPIDISNDPMNKISVLVAIGMKHKISLGSIKATVLRDYGLNEISKMNDEQYNTIKSKLEKIA